MKLSFFWDQVKNGSSSWQALAISCKGTIREIRACLNSSLFNRLSVHQFVLVERGRDDHSQLYQPLSPPPPSSAFFQVHLPLQFFSPCFSTIAPFNCESKSFTHTLLLTSLGTSCYFNSQNWRSSKWKCTMSKQCIACHSYGIWNAFYASFSRNTGKRQTDQIVICLCSAKLQILCIRVWFCMIPASL